MKCKQKWPGVTQRLSELANCSCFFSRCYNHQGVQVKPAPSDDRMRRNGQHGKDTVKMVLFCLVAQACPTLLWSIAHQAPLSMGFSLQEYWSGLPCPSPGDLPNPGMKSESPALAGGFFITEPPGNSSVSQRISDFLHLKCKGRIRLYYTPSK